VTIQDITFTPERWAQFWEAFKGEPQQRAGIEELRQAIAGSDPALITEGASWVANFHKEQPKPAVIKVPYFNQLQMDDGQGWRDCFSASCAMLAAWRGKVPPTTDGENQYNHIRQKHGDSTVAAAQVAALTELGLSACYSTAGTKGKLQSLLDGGLPVATGILHHGQASSPTGGGHWMVIVGYDEQGVIALDPYGELNVVNGTWAHQGSGGDHVHYSWKNWLPRWEVKGGDGYMLWVQ
jgi:hypothetical protein